MLDNLDGLVGSLVEDGAVVPLLKSEADRRSRAASCRLPAAFSSAFASLVRRNAASCRARFPSPSATTDLAAACSA
eukprot:scaffold8423_cov94-Phaeocystis_antarctica.AAC.1